jgi:hypothetical protein
VDLSKNQRKRHVACTKAQELSQTSYFAKMETNIMSASETVQPGEMSISCYIDEIPPFIETELVRLYATLHSSLPFFKVFRSIEHVSCYVVLRDDEPNIIILFTYRNRRIDVLNEMIEIEQKEIYRFTQYIFIKFPEADIISFKALKTNAYRFGFPMQKYDAKDTYVIALPDTPQEYTARMGKSTRTNIRYQTNNVSRNYPSFTTKFYVNQDIDEQCVREILRFSENRIKTKVAGFNHNEERIIRLARMCGFVCVLLIDGRVCAGSINYRVGSSYFGEVIGHDIQYEKYGLGKLVLYQTICEAIVRGGRKFFLGGGVFGFKSRMLGVQLCMDELQIYRSYGKLILNIDQAAKTIVVAYIRKLKSWLHRHKKMLFSQLVFKYFYFFKDKIAK